MVLLDTAAVIDLGRGHKPVVAKISAFERAGSPIRVPSPVVFELSAGSPAGLDEKRHALLSRMESVSFTDEHAEEAAIIYRGLREKGRDIGALDCMIAGVAKVEDEVLLTNDTKHFSRISGLRVEGYYTSPS